MENFVTGWEALAHLGQTAKKRDRSHSCCCRRHRIGGSPARQSGRSNRASHRFGGQHRERAFAGRRSRVRLSAEPYDATVQSVSTEGVVLPFLQRPEPCQKLSLDVFTGRFDVSVIHRLADLLANDFGQSVHRDIFRAYFEVYAVSAPRIGQFLGRQPRNVIGRHPGHLQIGFAEPGNSTGPTTDDGSCVVPLRNKVEKGLDLTQPIREATVALGSGIDSPPLYQSFGFSALKLLRGCALLLSACPQNTNTHALNGYESTIRET